MAAEFQQYCDRETFYRCPCCDHLTLKDRGENSICHVCFWEDDGVDDVLIATPFNPNHMTLAQGRLNYREIGACDLSMLKSVKPPTDEQRTEHAAWLETLR